MSKTYSEKLKDPRWQKKRLEIMERDNFKCQICGDSESMLNVHHFKYEFGKNPWDCIDNNLITLCEKCHKDIHGNYTFVKGDRVEAFFTEEPCEPWFEEKLALKLGKNKKSKEDPYKYYFDRYGSNGEHAFISMVPKNEKPENTSFEMMVEFYRDYLKLYNVVKFSKKHNIKLEFSLRGL